MVLSAYDRYKTTNSLSSILNATLCYSIVKTRLSLDLTRKASVYTTVNRQRKWNTIGTKLMDTLGLAPVLRRQ